MEYRKLTSDLKYHWLIPTDESPYKHIKDLNNPWFISMAKYTQEQYEQWQKTHTLSGITDSKTDRLWFDFDSVDNLQNAIDDARLLCKKLLDLGMIEQNIQICFSGHKGISVMVDLNKDLPVNIVGLICTNLGKELRTFDSKIYDNQRVFRIPFSKHAASGLYKIPITLTELNSWDANQVRELAKTNCDVEIDDIIKWYHPFIINKALLEHGQIVPVVRSIQLKTEGLDWLQKPKHWRSCKWALSQGYFQEGSRDIALMILASTYRTMGFSNTATYRLCKDAIERHVERTGENKFSKEELWNNIIEGAVFKDTWRGGQHSCKKDDTPSNRWLKDYCQSLDNHKCPDEEEETPCVTFDRFNQQFANFAVNHEQNIIKTGLKELDDNAMLLAYNLVGLVGAPGSGKTSLSLNYLRNASLSGISSVFFSLDMGLPIIYAKLVQKLTGHSFKHVLDVFKNNTKEKEKIIKQIQEEYKNVGFNFKSGLTIPDMRNIILKHEESTSQKVKLIIVDYLECIAGPYSDPIANTGIIANQLKDLANEMSACVLLLLQTQKHATPNISDPILTLRAVKGSSLIEQSCSLILGLWREGYNPATVREDKFASISVVKNRFGSLWQGDFLWDGVRGIISSIETEEQRKKLDDLKRRKKESENKNNTDSHWSS